MRAHHLLHLLYCLGLASCAYYGDIHGNSRQLDAASLSNSHIYKKTASTTANVGWWNKFKDPQLNQLISIALSDAPTIQIAEARVRQAQHLAEEASSAQWPSLDFNGYVQRQKFSEFGLVPPPFNGHTYNIGTLGLNFNYEFDFWGKNRQAVMAKVSEEYAAEAELAEARLVISAAVANTYFRLCSNIEQVKINNERWRLNKQILKIATKRAKQGIESEIPVKAIESNIQIVKLSLEQYKQAEGLSRHQLAVLLGKNPLATTVETQTFAFHHYDVTLPASLPARLLADRPDIDAAKLRVQAAASRINVVKARFFPDINLSALFSYQSVGLGHLFNAQSQDHAITGAIDLPIFDAGARRADLGVKYAEYDMAVNEYNQTILTALREVADQLSTLQMLGSQLTAQNTALNATQHNYKLYDSRYNHGIADYAQVLESKQSLIQQQSIQLDLQTRHLQAVVAMLKALGGNDLVSQG